jgi:hypothetical protein
MKHIDAPPARAARLTPPMLRVLMDHADGPRQIKASLRELRTLRSLRDRGLIYFNRLSRPTCTKATSRGRDLIAAMRRLETQRPASREDAHVNPVVDTV